MTAPADEGVTDMRNDLARARDDWMASEDGRRMSEPLGICVPPRFSPYLRNRLEAAFIAGWNAKERHDAIDPDCSGSPKDCPNNEGYGCDCSPAPPHSGESE